MSNELPTTALKVALEKRILNEFSSKILNEERMEKIVESRKTTPATAYSNMSFHCECDDKTCTQTIQLSTEEYQQVHRKTKHFIVVPSHVRLDLEEIITGFNDYVLVAKFFPGPART